MIATHNGSRNHSIFTMAGSPPKPLPPTSAAGSSSPKPPPPAFNITSHPSDEDLIVPHLRNRVVSGTRVDFIHEADLYGADPNKLTENRLPVTASNGEKAWYFFTPLRPKGSAENRMKRNVDTGREGIARWVRFGAVNDVNSNGQLLGQRRAFTFEEKGDGNSGKSPWRMTELRLNPNEGGPEAGSPDLLVLCKVYLSSRHVKAEYESSMAVAKADAEAPAASGAVTPGREGADEEIGAETAAGPGRKRKAGDRDSGAETVAASPGRQKKADGESADAAATGEIFADSKDPLDAAEKAAQQAERGVPRDSTFYDFFRGSSAPLDAPEEAEQEGPRDPRDRPHQLHDFFPDTQNP